MCVQNNEEVLLYLNALVNLVLFTFQSGDTFFTSDCLELCICSNGEMRCAEAGCKPNEECSADVNYKLGCLPIGKR